MPPWRSTGTRTPSTSHALVRPAGLSEAYPPGFFTMKIAICHVCRRVHHAARAARCEAFGGPQMGSGRMLDVTATQNVSVKGVQMATEEPFKTANEMVPSLRR